MWSILGTRLFLCNAKDRTGLGQIHFGEYVSTSASLPSEAAIAGLQLNDVVLQVSTFLETCSAISAKGPTVSCFSIFRERFPGIPDFLAKVSWVPLRLFPP